MQIHVVNINICTVDKENKSEIPLTVCAMSVATSVPVHFKTTDRNVLIAAVFVHLLDHRLMYSPV
jgi:hypothetical protein